MPKWLPKSCRRCHVKASDGYVISRRGLCRSCGDRRLQAAIAMQAAFGREDFGAMVQAQEVLTEPLPPRRVGGTPTHQRNDANSATVTD